jgi:hypothetical protein
MNTLLLPISRGLFWIFKENKYKKRKPVLGTRKVLKIRWLLCGAKTVNTCPRMWMCKYMKNIGLVSNNDHMNGSCNTVFGGRVKGSFHVLLLFFFFFNKGYVLDQRLFGNLVEIKILSPVSVFNKLFRWCLCMIKFEKY